MDGRGERGHPGHWFRRFLSLSLSLQGMGRVCEGSVDESDGLVQFRILVTRRLIKVKVYLGTFPNLFFFARCVKRLVRGVKVS